MIQFIKKLFGSSNRVDYAQLVQNGAVILDVRTVAEFKQGHLKGALNIPIQILSGQLSRLKKDSPVITCCASGMRSASAKNILKSAGFIQVHNGGGWASLERKMNL